MTASDGSPTRVMRTPLTAPAAAPMTRQVTMINGIDQWWIHRSPISSADSASIEAIDRSISPVMMISVIGSAMIARSPMLVEVVKRL